MNNPPAQSQFSTSSRAVEVFMCYSHEDEKWRKNLEAHLAALQKQGKILTWHDRAIEAGSEWAAEIKAHLDSAQVILLLISSDAIASTLYDEQMQWAIERHQAGTARVIPIILRPVDWDGTPFSHLTVLPTDGKPVTTWENPDVAFLNVAQGIRRVVERLAAGTPIAALDQQDCPYRGLFAFREEESALFFGRDRFLWGNGSSEVGLIKTAQTQPLLGIIGSSGSGKSSIVFAGLIPALRAQGNWLIESFRPEHRPFYGLASALVRLLEPNIGKTEHLIKSKDLAKEVQRDGFAEVISEIQRFNPNQRILLVIDQFEELYTLAQNPADQQHFVDILLEAIKVDNLSLVFTLRADFYSCVLSYRPFRDALQQFTPYLLSAMEREELQQAIEKPVELLGIHLEPGLAARILDDVSDEPGHLPLLEFALTQLWNRQKNQTLTHQGYEEIGGVKRALAVHAESIYSELSQEEKKQVEAIFVQLVQPNEGSEGTRRLATRQEIGQDRWQLATHLAEQNARLVVTGRNEQTGEETIEMVHEALIREWETLQIWIKNNRQFRDWQEHLRAEMHQWGEHKSNGDLLKGTKLGLAADYLEQKRDELNEDEITFIEKSLTHEKSQQLEKEKQNQEMQKLNVQLKQTNIDLGKANALTNLINVALVITLGISASLNPQLEWLKITLYPYLCYLSFSYFTAPDEDNFYKYKQRITPLTILIPIVITVFLLTSGVVSKIPILNNAWYLLAGCTGFVFVLKSIMERFKAFWVDTYIHIEDSIYCMIFIWSLKELLTLAIPLFNIPLWIDCIGFLTILVWGFSKATIRDDSEFYETLIQSKDISPVNQRNPQEISVE